MSDFSAPCADEAPQLDHRARNLWYQAVTEQLSHAHQGSSTPDILHEVASELVAGRAWFELQGAQILTSFEAAQSCAHRIAVSIRQRPDESLVNQMTASSVRRLLQD